VSEYLSCAETAKLIRPALKRAFPGVKFSVRSSTYSMGASIDIYWTDGPLAADVDKVAKPYAGAGFDGMIDLKTYNSDWLYPDGHVESFQSDIGHSYGTHTADAEGDQIPAEWAKDYTEGIAWALAHEVTDADQVTATGSMSMAFQLGVIDGAKRLAAGARLVHFGADHIFTHRDLSDGLRGFYERAVVFLAGEDGPFDGNRRYEFGIESRVYAEYGSALVYQIGQADPDVLDAALEREAKRRAGNALIWFTEEAQLAALDGAGPTGFYVTVRDGNRTGALLGPVATREDAEALVPLARKLADEADDRACWYAYGVTRVTMRPGHALPAGILSYLAELAKVTSGENVAPAAVS